MVHSREVKEDSRPTWRRGRYWSMRTISFTHVPVHREFMPHPDIKHSRSVQFQRRLRAAYNHISPTPGHTRLTTHPMILLPIRRQQSLIHVSIELPPTSMCATRLSELSLTTFPFRASAVWASGCFATGLWTVLSG